MSSSTQKTLKEFCRNARGDIIKMTTLAGSGHPGGSMSSLEIFALLWSQASVDPKKPLKDGRDRIIVSHGHTSPGVYATLGGLGYFDIERAVATFRKAGSPFEGHIERSIPGIELTTGNLGQGVSAGAGMALADRTRGIHNHVWVVTGDGEQQKGQIAEARRFIRNYGLNNITVVVDCNGLQISGRTDRVMYTDIAAGYRADGWDVTEVDGHSLSALYRALRPDETSREPRLVMAMTVMGKGVSFMENDAQYHGKALTPEQAGSALSELGLNNDLDELARLRECGWKNKEDFNLKFSCRVLDNEGTPIIYERNHKGDNRSAFGAALLDLAKMNADNLPIVFDCDLAGSVKTKQFGIEYPDHFFQSGIMEHNTATAAGAASISEKVVFWSDFGVFAADETFNQHRLNDINLTNLKVVATHCGLDVGMDGKTHHCINYISLMGTLYHYNTVVPADPNQTDRVIRYAATHPGNFFIAMGRSKLPVITKENGEPFFGRDYRFEYGLHDHIGEGSDIAIVAMGNMVYRAIKTREMLRDSSISAAVYAVSCPLCINPGLLDELSDYRLVLTLEDHDVDTGMGSKMAVAISRFQKTINLRRKGITQYGASGDSEDLYRMAGLLPEQIAEYILTELS
ncbi:MAG: transketolase [Candidatus Aegiribacteria sp.]|nr:transketolase [Candidatus Aegiribacteria sp.]